ncbi:MAG: cyclomaltodextrinase C-terminal domain-containing protein, partial [Muribaculaceae bacterium]|nr:cyclomaltodextrinase C-terminal domain-containing protein [Muribaculaceae bacterium]
TSRYAEILHEGDSLTDSMTGTPLTVGSEITLAPRQTLVLQNF